MKEITSFMGFRFVQTAFDFAGHNRRLSSLRQITPSRIVSVSTGDPTLDGIVNPPKK